MTAETWYRQDTIQPGITRITEPHVHPYFSANLWLITGRDADLLVDFGMGILPLAPVLDRSSAKPLIAVATHAHVDHVGAFHEFDMRLGSKRSADAFATLPDDVTLAHLFRGLPDPVLMRPEPGWDVAAYHLRPAPLVRQLAEGDRIDMGDRSFMVLELPGHSPDSIALFDEKTGLLISGDAVYGGALVDDLPGSDPVVYVETMKRLSKLPADLVLAGHNGPISGKAMQLIALDYIQRAGQTGGVA